MNTLSARRSRPHSRVGSPSGALTPEPLASIERQCLICSKCGSERRVGLGGKCQCIAALQQSPLEEVVSAIAQGGSARRRSPLELRPIGVREALVDSGSRTPPPSRRTKSSFPPGDVVLLTDADIHLTEVVGLVGSIAYGDDSPTVQVIVFEPLVFAQ